MVYPTNPYFPIFLQCASELIHHSTIKKLQAGDTNFFIIIEESVVKILKFFKQYEIETGVIIIISKATITPLANAKINNLDKKIKSIQINNPKN